MTIAMWTAAARAQHTLANCVTKEELVEAVTHLAFYGGWPVANSAIPALRQVFAKTGA